MQHLMQVGLEAILLYISGEIFITWFAGCNTDIDYLLQHLFTDGQAYAYMYIHVPCVYPIITDNQQSSAKHYDAHLEQRVSRIEMMLDSITQTQAQILDMLKTPPTAPYSYHPTAYTPSDATVPSIFPSAPAESVPPCTQTLPCQSNTTANLPPLPSPLQTTSSDTPPSDVCPVPLPVCNKLNNMPLPPSLNNTGLYPIEDVLEIYEHYITKKNNPATLAQILAKEAVFGPHIMEQCTPTGTKILRALPQQGLMKIKTALFKYFPTMWRSPESFEEIWKKCQIAIEQACGRLRRARKIWYRIGRKGCYI